MCTASHRSCARQAMAIRRLAEKGIAATVVNHSYANQIHAEDFRSILAGTGGNLITVEDHQKKGGVGSMLVATLLDAGISLGKVRILGVDGHFGQSAYTATQLLALHGLDAVGIEKTAIELLS
jgi:transketolase C-terminal domain/subunit